jgi:hypothetical protein
MLFLPLAASTAVGIEESWVRIASHDRASCNTAVCELVYGQGFMAQADIILSLPPAR